uniref:Uncharacterized protein n=1 Tax=Siphoviridae sp. ctq8D8 TaxID=2827944 RepID=A0A8S5SMB6_9CAUD|nr:MAG TPA: hypothetical protein [Siphoviridae sp. ctq8D8]
MSLRRKDLPAAGRGKRRRQAGHRVFDVPPSFG